MGADYPLALWVPADPSNYRVAHRPGYSQVVIHCTDGHERAQPVADMFATPKEKRDPPVASSAHFIVGQAAEVIQCVSLADIAWHAHSANGSSVGIEHCARTPHELGPTDPGLPPSDALYGASAKLAAWLLRRAWLQPTRDVIKGHSEADPTTSHTRCPLGCGWDWDRYMQLVQQEYDAYDHAS